MLIRQVTLAAVFFQTIFQHLRWERKNPRRASPLRGFQLSGCSGKPMESAPSASPTAQKSLSVRRNFRAKAHFYSSDEDFFLVRPDAVKSTRDKVIKILEDVCSKYATASEQDGPANGSHPGRPETNGTSSTAGSHHSP